MASKIEDRERMKTLLVEAIATLCRNGLQYEEELCVEGLIGITLDKKDVFLVNVKESFIVSGKTPKEVASVESPGAVRRKKKRRRTSSQNDESPEKQKRSGESMLHHSDGAYTSGSDNESGIERLQSVDDEPFDHNLTYSSDQGGKTPKKKESEPVVVIDPDLSIKQEMVVKQEKRSQPPTDEDADVPGVIFAHEVQADSDPSLSVFSSNAPMPVNLYTAPPTSQGTPQGIPQQWPSTSFSQQAPGTPGASQEGPLMYEVATAIGTEGKKAYYCQACSKTLVLSLRGMYFHKERHKGVQYNCPVCGKPYSFKHNMKVHVRQAHPGAVV